MFRPHYNILQYFENIEHGGGGVLIIIDHYCGNNRPPVLCAQSIVKMLCAQNIIPSFTYVRGGGLLAFKPFS